MNVLDVFSGAGGFSLGFKMAGYKIAGAIEIDKWAAEIFQMHESPLSWNTALTK